MSFKNGRRSLLIENHGAMIKTNWVAPSIQPATEVNGWTNFKTFKKPLKLSGLPGTCTYDFFRNNSLEAVREVWISANKKIVAVRQKFINRRANAVQLNLLIPLAIPKNGMVLKQNPQCENWNILIQKRFKNDVPECFVSKGNVSFKADPFFITPLTKDPLGPSLLIGYLNQTSHLARFTGSFKTEGDNTILENIDGEGEFNGVTLPKSGGERTSQWVYISTGPSFEQTINDYTDRVGIYHNIPPPTKKAPTVYCSWYYHGWSYNEELFKKDIQTFKNDRLPFDVFLIDESWDVNRWGDLMPNNQFPAGMKKAADMIKEIGYVPGIWSCPYLIDTASDLAKVHPEWVLKTSSGKPFIFKMNRINHWVLDPTSPGALEYLEQSYRRISRDWGYRYFKFDFMRAVLVDGDYHFFNPLINRLEAYKMGLEAIRRGVGEDAYISVCGGHYGGSIGIANSQRSGSDVFSYWDEKEIAKYRQNILRTWMNRFWHVDPDAMMVRRSNTKVHPGLYEDLSLGRFTDNEAKINALNQYIGGGLVSFSEDFSIIDQDRKELYKHVLPSVNSSSFPLDWEDPNISSYMVTTIRPICKKLGNWNTVSIVNWSEKSKPIALSLNQSVLKDLEGSKFLLFEFFSQQVRGIYTKNDLVQLGSLDPHSAVLYKIIPWNGKKPVLAGTDLHFSMGGVEIGAWKSNSKSVSGEVKTKWQLPVRITVLFPTGNGDDFIKRTIDVKPNVTRFKIEAIKDFVK
jgi:hypothetical protein